MLNDQCVTQCPQDFQKTDNVCTKESHLIKLVSQFPLIYLLLLGIVILCIVKISCSEFSLTMALLTITANLEAISIVLLSIGCIKYDLKDSGLNDIEQLLVLIIPMSALIIALVVNGGAVCAHYWAVRRIKGADNQEEIDEWWDTNGCKIPLVYLLSLLLSFHNLTWLQFPQVFHPRLKSFTRWYFCLT